VMGQKKAKSHHVSSGKSRLARAALPFSLVLPVSGSCKKGGGRHTGAHLTDVVPHISSILSRYSRYCASNSALAPTRS